MNMIYEDVYHISRLTYLQLEIIQYKIVIFVIMWNLIVIGPPLRQSKNFSNHPRMLDTIVVVTVKSLMINFDIKII